MHTVLAPLLAEYGERVAFRRLHLPLSQHEHAEGAARAVLCAEAQGRGEEMADRLFRIELSPESVSAAAEALRLDPVRYDACLDSAQTTAALERDAALMPEDEFEGLPMTYIGEEALLGSLTETKLRDSLERAARPARQNLSAPVYLALVGLILALVGWFGRAAPTHSRAASQAPAPTASRAASQQGPRAGPG
jgi:protein-disulfide isomerase